MEDIPGWRFLDGFGSQPPTSAQECKLWASVSKVFHSTDFTFWEPPLFGGPLKCSIPNRVRRAPPQKTMRQKVLAHQVGSGKRFSRPSRLSAAQRLLKSYRM